MGHQREGEVSEGRAWVMGRTCVGVIVVSNGLRHLGRLHDVSLAARARGSSGRCWVSIEGWLSVAVGQGREKRQVRGHTPHCVSPGLVFKRRCAKPVHSE